MGMSPFKNCFYGESKMDVEVFRNIGTAKIDKVEYIRKDLYDKVEINATQNIRMIYEKYKDFKTLPPMDIWSAIKADLKIE